MKSKLKSYNSFSTFHQKLNLNKSIISHISPSMISLDQQHGQNHQLQNESIYLEIYNRNNMNDEFQMDLGSSNIYILIYEELYINIMRLFH